MSYCQGSILVGQATKPIEVLFSSGAGSSYISELRASELHLSTSVEDSPIVFQGVSSRQANCTTTASIDIALGSFRHVVDILVIPSDLPYLVLGMDWFEEYNPRIDWAENSMLVTSDGGVRHKIQMTKRTSRSTSYSEEIILPSMSVVGRVQQSKPQTQARDKTKKGFSRNKIVKEGWGNRRKFQAAYGLSMEDKDIQKGNKILKAMEKADRKARLSRNAVD